MQFTAVLLAVCGDHVKLIKFTSMIKYQQLLKVTEGFIRRFHRDMMMKIPARVVQ